MSLHTDRDLQKQLFGLMKKHPIMAHNAVFEESRFMIHLEGYAEARRAGKIVAIDTRDICLESGTGQRAAPARKWQPPRGECDSVYFHASRCLSIRVEDIEMP